MPTDKPRVTITMPEDQLVKIQNFQHDNKMKNQTQAILHLIEIGFQELENMCKEEAPTSGATDMSASDLSTEEKLRIMLKQFGLISETDDLNDSDLAFLQHMFMAIQAHFEKP